MAIQIRRQLEADFRISQMTIYDIRTENIVRLFRVQCVQSHTSPKRLAGQTS